MLTYGGSERSRDNDGVPMGLRPIKSDEGAAGGWRGINDLRRVFNRAVGQSTLIAKMLYMLGQNRL
jgi:hypothetical protein